MRRSLKALEGIFDSLIELEKKISISPDMIEREAAKLDTLINEYYSQMSSDTQSNLSSTIQKKIKSLQNGHERQFKTLCEELNSDFGIRVETNEEYQAKRYHLVVSDKRKNRIINDFFTDLPAWADPDLLSLWGFRYVKEDSDVIIESVNLSGLLKITLDVLKIQEKYDEELPFKEANSAIRKAFYLGCLNMERQEYDKAVSFFGPAVRDPVLEVEASKLTGMCYYEMEDYRAAASILHALYLQLFTNERDKRSVSREDKAHVIYLLATSLSNLGHDAVAVPYFRDILTNYSDFSMIEETKRRFDKIKDVYKDKTMGQKLMSGTYRRQLPAQAAEIGEIIDFDNEKGRFVQVGKGGSPKS